MLQLHVTSDRFAPAVAACTLPPTICALRLTKMLRRAACLLLLLLAATGAMAQQAAPTSRQPRILLLVDGSSSMLQPWNDKDIRFKTAGNIVTSLMDSIYAVNADVEFGLRVYGHQSPAQNNDCFDSRQEVMFSKNNLTQMGLRMASIRPFGVSPIAYSLQEAATNDLVDEARNAYSIILITDGGESCGGNICDVVKQLIDRKIYFKPYIISLVNYEPLKKQYECLGTYLQAAKPEDIPVAIRTIVDAYRPMLSAPIPLARVEPAAPRRDTQQINIPRWIPSISSVESLIIRVPKTEFPVSYSRPRLLPLRIPPLARISKSEPEPVAVIQPTIIREIIPGLSPLRQRSFPVSAATAPAVTRRSIAVALDLPFIKAAPEAFIALAPITSTKSISVPVFKSPGGFTRRNISLGLELPFIKADQESFASLSPLFSRPGFHIAPLKIPSGLSRRSNSVVVELPFLKQEAVSFATLVPNTALRSFSVPFAKIPAAFARRNPVVAVNLPVIPAEKRDTIIAVKPAIQPTPKRDTMTRTTVAIKPLDPAANANNAARPSRPTATKPKETVFTKITEDAKETSLSVIFTDGKGKFYASAPQLQLLDAVSGKLVKQFWRTVDESGNPDPQVVPPGTYNLLIAGRSNMLMRRVTIDANKNNKVVVQVNNGSLRFRYVDANDYPVERPITEFEAIVNIRFEPGPTIRQRCTAELEYPPGTYYIEVNTMPISRFSVDIDFGAITEIHLPQPGYVQFTNTAPKGRIMLFHPLGNKFVRFADVNVTGNPAAQRLMLKPGAYEVHWVKNPNMPYASETVERFNIQSNAITEIELR